MAAAMSTSMAAARVGSGAKCSAAAPKSTSQRAAPGSISGARLASKSLFGKKFEAKAASPYPKVASSVKVVRAVAELEKTEDEKPKYSVYAAPIQRLEEGVSKHTINVFVADEPGLINRVAGVFARRGYNIDSLAVGLNIDKALFTIVVTGTDREIKQLCKQVQKLVKVRTVEDLTYTRRVDRELALIKIGSADSLVRLEIMRLVEVFRGSVIDITPDSVTLAITGDTGKTIALQRALSAFGVREVARTGKISLTRGENKNSTPTQGGWGDSTVINDKSKARLQRLRDAEEIRDERARQVGYDDADAIPDVYSSSMDESENIWDVQILDPVVEQEYETGIKPHVLSITVGNTPGVLDKVTGIVARRGYNVQSLAVGPAESEAVSRITMVVPGTEATIKKLVKQLEKLIDVVAVKDLESKPHVDRELMLIKVRCSSQQRGELKDLAQIFRGHICDVGINSISIEVMGKTEKMATLQLLLEPYGIIEVARTGTVSMTRESGVNSLLVESSSLIPSL